MNPRAFLLALAFGLALVAAARHTVPAPAAEITTYHYLPHVAAGECPPFFDTFDADQGWFLGQSGGLAAELVGGEYRLAFTGNGAVWLMPGPGCARENYRAAVDARWAGAPGNFIGLLFGIDDTRERAYLFAVNTDQRVWLLFEAGPQSLVTLIPPTAADAVLPGWAANRLQAERRGDIITLSVNGVVVGQLPDPAPAAPVLAGVAAAAYTTQAAADARFDNFVYGD